LPGHYLANTVLFATVLFFAGTSGKFEQRRVRVLGFIFAAAVFAFPLRAHSASNGVIPNTGEVWTSTKAAHFSRPFLRGFARSVTVNARGGERESCSRIDYVAKARR
jgi:hypothetical protein